jgi:uncharacterized protein YbaA (DUF1428 family)
MYIQGFIVPVRGDKQDDYREVAERFWPIARDNGAIDQVEAWEADVSDEMPFYGKRMYWGGFSPIAVEGR